jgi:hypothetical protein
VGRDDSHVVVVKHYRVKNELRDGVLWCNKVFWSPNLGAKFSHIFAQPP